RLDHLDLVAQALHEAGPQRAVDQPAGEDRVLAGPALAAEERAGDAARGVHPLLDVDREREEVELALGLPARRRGGQHHRVAELAACRASRPVEKTISRVPKAPLSMTARAYWVPRLICSVMVVRCSLGLWHPRLEPSAAGLRSKRPGWAGPHPGGHYRGPVR